MGRQLMMICSPSLSPGHRDAELGLAREQCYKASARAMTWRKSLSIKMKKKLEPQVAVNSLVRSQGTITDISGITVGHAENKKAQTGCTVVLCGVEGAVAAVDVRGAAPGTRETDLLEPENLVERVHAVVLSGGSVFGLDSACGVVRFLEERGIGLETGAGPVPIVPAAVIFDLTTGDSDVRPDAKMGYLACTRSSAGPLPEGRVGAGAGATVGKILGHRMSSPGGIGTASLHLTSGPLVGALVVVNAFGDIVDPDNGQILAGARSSKGGWLNTSQRIVHGSMSYRHRLGRHLGGLVNTTLAVVATDAALTKAQAKRVAVMAHDGMARSIRPIHTMFDGDLVFVLSTGTIPEDVTAVGSAAAEAVALAICRVGKLSGSATKGR